MTIIHTSKPFAWGLRELSIAGNGRLTDGYNLATIANTINMLSGRRVHVLANGGLPTATSVRSTTGRTRFRTSYNSAGVEVVMVLGHSSSTTALGKVIWTVGGTAQSTQYVGGSNTTAGPNDLTVMRQRFVDGSGDDLVGDTVYDADFTTTGAYVISYVVYDVPRATLDTSTEVAVPMDIFGVNSPILDRDIADVTDSLWLLYRRQGPIQFTWDYIDGIGGTPTQTGTTYKNILDATTGGYAANAAGFWTIPYGKNRLAGTTVDVVFWCFGKTNTGSGGRVKFSNSAGTLATITGITTGAGAYYTATATLDATISTSDLVIAEHSDSGGNTITTYAVGCYEFLT